MLKPPDWVNGEHRGPLNVMTFAFYPAFFEEQAGYLVFPEIMDLRVKMLHAT